MFARKLALTADDAEILRGNLLAAVREGDAIPQDEDNFGRRFVIESMMIGPQGRALVRSAWIVRRGEDFPRLTSCYVA